MKVALRISGGFANLRIQGEIDTGELPRSLAERIEAGLASDKLRAAAESHDPRMADGQIYELTILPETEDGELQRFVIDDSTVEVEILDVFDELLHEILRRKRSAAAEKKEAAEKEEAEAEEAETEEAETEEAETEEAETEQAETEQAETEQAETGMTEGAETEEAVEEDLPSRTVPD